MQRHIDATQILFGQRADCRLQTQLADQVVVLRLIQVAPCREQLLLRIEHVQTGSDTHLLPQLAGVQQAFTGFQGLLQRLYLGNTAGHAQVGLAGLQFDVAARGFQVLFGLFAVGLGFAPFGLDRPALEQRQVELYANGVGMGVAGT